MDDNVEFFIKKFNVSRETIDKLKIYKDFLILSNNTPPTDYASGLSMLKL